MHTLPKNKTELAMIIAAERSQAEIKAVELAYKKLEDVKVELMEYLITEATKDLSEPWKVKMRDWLVLKSPVECFKVKPMTGNLIDSNNRRFKPLENGYFKCEDCNCYTSDPSNHECPPWLKEVTKRGKNESKN